MGEIKTAVYTYWAKPFVEKNVYSNFQRKNDLLVSLKLVLSNQESFLTKLYFTEITKQFLRFVKSLSLMKYTMTLKN